MKIKENIFEIFFSFFLISFVISTFFYTPRPKLKKLAFPEKIYNNKSIKKKIFKYELDKSVARKINIGNTFIVSLDDVYFEITPISILEFNNFNLSEFSKYLPELILDTQEVLTNSKNNFGIYKLNNKKLYQTCFFNIDEPFFLYKSKKANVVYRFNDFNYWLSTYKYELRRIFRNNNQKSKNCLLIKTPDSLLLKDNLSILTNIISKYFIYK